MLNDSRPTGTLHEQGGVCSLLFLVVFFMYFVLANIFQNLIKTDKLSLDFSFLIHSLEDVEDGHRPICFTTQDQISGKFTHAPANSIYERLWNNHPHLLIDKNAEGGLRGLNVVNNCVVITSEWYM